MTCSHRPIAGLFAPFVALSLAGCTPSQDVVAAMTAQAQQLLDAGQPGQAQAEILQALRKRDDLPATYIVKAHIALALGNRGDAYQAYANALALEATNMEALLGVSQLGLSTGHVLEADDAASKLLLLDPNQTGALLTKGMIKMARHDLEGAIGFSDRILAVKPDDIGGLILKSRTLALSGNGEAALALIRQNIDKTGSSLEMTMSLAELQRWAGDGPGFLASLRQIRQKAPTNRGYRFDLIDLLYRLGRIDEARVEAAALLGDGLVDAEELTRFPRLWQAYDRQGLTTLQIGELAEKAPIEQRIALGRYFVATGNAPAAMALIRPVATGWSLDIQSVYARIAETTGHEDMARRAADAILLRDPDNGDALLIKANAALGRGDPAAAIVDLQRVAHNYPRWEEGYLGLAQAYTMAKKPAGIRRAFGDAHRALPQSLPIARAYVQSLIAMGDRSRAVEVARRFALDSPSLQAAWTFYATVCAQAPTSDCRSEAADGLARAKTRFGLDLPPGTPPPIALIGRLT